VIQVNNDAWCASATSEFMDVGVTDESEITDKGNLDQSEIMDMESINNALEFIFGLCVLKVILSNTNSLCRYLQGKTVDVISARRNADMTIQTLRQCRSEESFSSVWQIASTMGLKIKKWLTNSQFELQEARAPRQTPSRCLQALVGEHVQRQTQLTPESHHLINTYYVSIDKVLSELELRFTGNDQEILCALGNICHSETPDKESFSRIAKFYKIDGEILEAEQKM